MGQSLTNSILEIEKKENLIMVNYGNWKGRKLDHGQLDVNLIIPDSTSKIPELTNLVQQPNNRCETAYSNTRNKTIKRKIWISLKSNKRLTKLQSSWSIAESIH